MHIQQGRDTQPSSHASGCDLVIVWCLNQNFLDFFSHFLLQVIKLQTNIMPTDPRELWIFWVKMYVKVSNPGHWSLESEGNWTGFW